MYIYIYYIYIYILYIYIIYIYTIHYTPYFLSSRKLNGFFPKKTGFLRQVKPVCEEIAVAVNARPPGDRDDFSTIETMDQAVAPPIGWFTTPRSRSYG